MDEQQPYPSNDGKIIGSSNRGLFAKRPSDLEAYNTYNRCGNDPSMEVFEILCLSLLFLYSYEADFEQHLQKI